MREDDAEEDDDGACDFDGGFDWDAEEEVGLEAEVEAKEVEASAPLAKPVLMKIQKRNRSNEDTCNMPEL